MIGGIDWVKLFRAKQGPVTKLVEKGKVLAGPELMGKTLGIIGLSYRRNGSKRCYIPSTNDSDDPYLSVKGAWGLSRRYHMHLTITRSMKI